MKYFLVFICLSICLLALSEAAPADTPQTVQFIKYSNDKEFEEIQKQIIAQYDHLGGTSEFHQAQSAPVLDIRNFRVNVK